MADQFSPPWLPWFHRDFIAATQGWTLLERGAYFMLLGAQWELGPLPSDRRRLAGIIGSHVDELETVWAVIAQKFKATDRGLVNERLEEHRERQAARSEKARQSARLRWGAECDSHADASANAHANASRAHAKSGANSMLPDPDPDPDPKPEPRTNGAGPHQHTRGRSAPPVLHQQVIDAYHELLPDLPQVRGWSPKRRQALDARIRERCGEGKPADTVTYWRELFELVALSDFLCGRSTDFRADLEWLLRPENFLKVIEGRYVNRQVGNGARHHA
jgi:uncharacterized protein YdaU (DUF1376 family)